eukprot:3492926-Pyramimonas_sp.AAC.1
MKRKPPTPVATGWAWSVPSPLLPPGRAAVATAGPARARASMTPTARRSHDELRLPSTSPSCRRRPGSTTRRTARQGRKHPGRRA